jgi:hypothetical protein
MGVEYDPQKSDWTFRTRGFDFDFAAKIFDGPFIEWPSPRSGESRFLAVGWVDATFIAVADVWRCGRRRIIMARPARRRERDAYRQKIARTDPP